MMVLLAQLQRSNAAGVVSHAISSLRNLEQLDFLVEKKITTFCEVFDINRKTDAVL